MKRYLILLLALAMLLAGCQKPADKPDTTGDTASSENATSDTTETTDNTPKTGWVEEEGQTRYLYEDGTYHTGWLELDGKLYYLGETGVMQTGWLELDGNSYYLKKDGSAARGKLEMNMTTYYFTSTGARIILVNPWNFMPSDYETNFVEAERGRKVDALCKDSLLEMLEACRDAGYNVKLLDGARTRDDQIYLFNRKVNYYLDRGYEPDEARAKAGTSVAMPGTSEHELGLAVDLVDGNNYSLDESQESTPAQKWLMENCWDYGWILRYPNDKTEVTGIIYEPWHYRYVGTEVAKELQESGLCLEEYLASLS